MLASALLALLVDGDLKLMARAAGERKRKDTPVRCGGVGTTTVD
jgi:hypothetical protein